jgi:formate dehydrogenase iron-sulfur subunit
MHNNLNDGIEKTGGREREHGLVAGQWTMVNTFDVERNGEPVRRSVKEQCLHCQEPVCAEVCFALGLTKTPAGPVIYDGRRVCVGCRYCQLACPFGAIAMEWGEVFSRVSKCQMCPDRLREGLAPACTVVCPTEALQFGRREDLLREARQRIGKHPNRYVAHIFGEKEVGGTSWLYLSDVPFAELGFNTEVMHKSVTTYTWKYISKAPILAVGLPLAFAALYTYTKRRSENENDH